MATVDLYLTPSSTPCRAVLMTAKYIGVNVNKKHIDIMAGEQLKPEFLKMNPQHCVPTLDDHGFYLWEGRAIQTYLANKYAPESCVYPKEPEERALVDRMLYFDMTLYKNGYEYLVPQLMQGKPGDALKLDSFKAVLSLLEEFLNKTEYVAGDHITLADFSILATLAFTEFAGFSYSDFPRISAWFQKLKSEVPSYVEINEEPLKEFVELMKSKK